MDLEFMINSIKCLSTRLIRSWLVKLFFRIPNYKEHVRFLKSRKSNTLLHKSFSTFFFCITLEGYCSIIYFCLFFMSGYNVYFFQNWKKFTRGEINLVYFIWYQLVTEKQHFSVVLKFSQICCLYQIICWNLE